MRKGTCHCTWRSCGRLGSQVCPLASAPFAACCRVSPPDPAPAHPALAETVRLLLAAHPAGAEALDGEGRTAAQVGSEGGADEGALALVRRAEFVSEASQSLLG